MILWLKHKEVAAGTVRRGKVSIVRVWWYLEYISEAAPSGPAYDDESQTRTTGRPEYYV